MARRRSQSILLSDGRQAHLCQHEGESPDEFRGRALCYIEEAIMGRRGSATPAGTRWFRWDWDGENLGTFTTHGSGVLVQSTGEPYQNRTRYLPGSFSLQEARKHLGM